MSFLCDALGGLYRAEGRWQIFVDAEIYSQMSRAFQWRAVFEQKTIMLDKKEMAWFQIDFFS